MAAIGDGWATDAWIEASWETGAWLVGDLPVVLEFLRPQRGLEAIEAGAVDKPRLFFRLEPSVDIPVVLDFLRPQRGLEAVEAGAVDNPRLYFRLEPSEVEGGVVPVKKVRRKRLRMRRDDYERYLESLDPQAPPLTEPTLLRRVRAQSPSTAIVTLEPSWRAVNITNLDDAIAQASRPVPTMLRTPWDETEDEEALIRFLTSIS